MGFNFNGMMRGLGTGMVSTGALMEKYNERKFEEEQLQAKLDREEHMERLRQQAIIGLMILISKTGEMFMMRP